jgi:hypothetical protein
MPPRSPGRSSPSSGSSYFSMTSSRSTTRAAWMGDQARVAFTPPLQVSFLVDVPGVGPPAAGLGLRLVDQDPPGGHGRPGRSDRPGQPGVDPGVDGTAPEFVGVCSDRHRLREHWQPPDPGRPVVLISLGTFCHPRPDFFRRCLDAFADTDWSRQGRRSPALR